MENNNKLQFCPKCGSPLIAGKNFCSQCGTNITLAQQQPTQQANPYAQPQQPTQQANPYAQPQQPAQQANPYARPQQPTQQANPYARPQQPAQQANPYARPQQPTQQANPYARPQQPTQQANPYAQPQQPTQQANPYARPQQPAQQANPYTRPQQPTQQANPYARPQQPTQQANPYARPQQPTQQANPYAQPQQPTQQANPYARPQQPTQQANPYAQPQQPTQQANPYAQPQQPTQQANPYAQPQQPTQQANPYAQPQQPAQQTNPYINNQSTQGVVNSVEKNSADNDFSQPINPYAPSMTASENLVAPKKRSKKPFIIAGVSVVGVAAVAVAGVMVWNMLKPSGGPITKIADSAKQLAKANSATISASVEANGEKTKCDISYELDASKKEIVLVMNGSNSGDTFKGVVYCKDGVRKSAITANGNTTYTEIDEETLNNFFDSINKTNAEQELDWNSLLEDADLKDYIDTTKIDAVSNSLKNTFENGNGKEALGITESAVDNGTKYSFDINTYKTLSVIVDEIEPLFKDKSKYNELKNELPEAESYLNSINLKFDITVDNAGYLSGFAFNSFGAKIDFSISKIGNTKVELSESEINDIKNAKAEPTTGYIPEATPSAGYMPDKYYWNWK